jgi:hypothetical protein
MFGQVGATFRKEIGMKLRNRWVLGVGIAAMALVGRQVFSQQEAHEMTEEEAKMMEAWAKAATPGEHHEHLKPLAGHFNATSRWRMSAEAEWGESNGTAEFTWIMDGRFLVQKVQADMDGQPFEGMGVMGFDNVTGKHYSAWWDSMGTGMMSSTGTCDASGKVVTYYGEYADPMTGQQKKSKSIHRVINNDKHVFEMYDRDENGKEFQSLEVTYTRR